MRLPPALVLLLLLAPAAAAAQPLAEHGDAAFAEAFALFEAGLYAEAAHALEAFRGRYADHPRVPDAYFFGGQAELAAGRSERAAALLTRFRQRYPRHPLAPRARLAVGEYHFARGEDDLAISALVEALREEQPPDDAAQALLLIGQAHLRQGRLDDAAAELQRAATLYPRAPAAPAALYTLGVAEAERGEWAGAASAFERLGTRYRRTHEDRLVGLALAEAYLRTGQYDRVVAEVDRRLPDLPEAGTEGGLPLAPGAALGRRAQRDRAHHLAGEALMRLGRPADAEARFSAVDPDGPYGRHAALGLGRIAFDRSAWLDAAEHLSRTRPPHDGEPLDALAAEGLYLEGLALKNAFRLDDAGQRFAAIAERAPASAFADVALFERGLLLYTTRRWDEAAVAFEAILDRYPTSTYAGEAARMLGETYAALQDFERAEQAGRRAQQLGAAPAGLAIEVTFQRGYRALHDGRLDEAERILMEVLSAEPSGERAGEALFWAAEAAFQAGQSGQRGGYDRALERFQAFLTRFPDHRQRDAARYALAWTYFKRGDYARAAEGFERFLASYRPTEELVPYTADARLRLGDSYFALRRWDQALAAYRRVEGAGADYARFQIGQALGILGRFDEAQAAYNRLLSDFAASPLRPQALYAISELHFQRGDYTTAITGMRDVIARYPASPIAAKAQYTIGEAFYNLQRFDEALVAYRAVLERYPTSPLVPDAVSALEITLSALGREGEIRQIVDSYSRRNPGGGAVDEVRFRQAESRFQRGDHAGAAEDLQALLGTVRDPELRAPILLYLGRAHVHLGRGAQAEAAFRRLIDEHPGSPLRAEAERRLGARYLADQRFAEALPLYRSAVRTADDPVEAAEARLGEAAALIGLRRHAEAEPLLQAVLADAPSLTLATRARLRLADLYDASNRRAAAARLYEEIARDEAGALGAEAAARLAASLLAQGDAQALIAATDRLDVERRFAGYPPFVADVLLHRARAFRRLGQPGRAQESYDRVLRAYADTPAAALARRERDA